MGFVHSIWSRPMIYERRGTRFINGILTTTLCNATSVAWIKHNGGKIDLYTDGFGKDLLGYLPYDNIYELTVPDNIPVCNWACGKFLALEKMPLGDIHIDGDVFLKTENLLNIISDNSYDLVVQSIEDDKTTLKKYYTLCRNIFKQGKLNPLSCSLEEMPSYNCGTVGFFNEELKRKYLIEYFSMLKNIIKAKDIQKALLENTMAIPDLIMEQQFLYEISAPYKVNNILGDSNTAYKNAISLNYQHLLGEFKEKQMDKIIQELRYVDEDIYVKTRKHLKYLIDIEEMI